MNCDHSFHDLEVLFYSDVVSRSSHFVIPLYKNWSYRDQSHYR